MSQKKTKAGKQVTEMKREEVINRDPEIFSGEPVFAGTRVPVKFLIDYLKRGETIEEFLDIHEGVSSEQVCSLLDMALSALVGEHEASVT